MSAGVLLLLSGGAPFRPVGVRLRSLCLSASAGLVSAIFVCVLCLCVFSLSVGCSVPFGRCSAPFAVSVGASFSLCPHACAVHVCVFAFRWFSVFFSLCVCFVRLFVSVCVSLLRCVSLFALCFSLLCAVCVCVSLLCVCLLLCLRVPLWLEVKLPKNNCLKIPFLGRNCPFYFLFFVAKLLQKYIFLSWHTVFRFLQCFLDR